MIPSKVLEAAHTAGVDRILTEQAGRDFEFAVREGFVKLKTGLPGLDGILRNAARSQLTTASFGVKLAAVVIIHNAVDLYLWRLVRFGLLFNRVGAISRIEERKVAVRELASKTADDIIDESLEKWWRDLERESVLKKWDALTSLFEYPSKLSDGTWSFDRPKLEEFDTLRHNAVHDDGEPLRDFDVMEFLSQASRAAMVWLIQVCRSLHLRLPAEAMWGIG